MILPVLQSQGIKPHCSGGSQQQQRQTVAVCGHDNKGVQHSSIQHINDLE